ncbi:hypothetical protein [Rufibacter tibetensis]|uniref:Lipoprotein n=1 Tax=Rufibacter tibetensis TaxID=512763 RepID=A0A0P0C6V5_9BACT|nr:hypothetical protein [Rufibacter tibetensis]ALJ01007.1 hypothetical protein DC20_20950 [Rufibacter tibetensis]
MFKPNLSKLMGAMLVPALFLSSCSEEEGIAPDALRVESSASLTGNGAPSGAHYNLNIIGVPKGKSAPMDSNSGQRIFVNLEGKTKINLANADLTDGAFRVLDANGTDGDGATFQLPSPDADGDGLTSYSVYARALGKPGGGVVVTTCATDVATGEDVCSLESLVTMREKGGSKFQNVSDQLLSIVADITDDGIDNPVRYPLFSDELEGYYWDYDNSGLKVLQLRFYEVPTAYSPVQ